MNLKITIVTPSYNQGQFLEETIDSILGQNYPNLEYMIIDGGSTDNSVAIIKKNEKHLTYWVSEKDQGQTHAINKGFRRATGEVVNWINSDDLLEPNALHTLAEAISTSPSADVYYGDYRAIDGQTQSIYTRKSAPYLPACLFWARQLSSQPAVFFKRKLLENFGYLDENYHFCMDIEFWVRVAQHGVIFQQIKSMLGVTRVHGEAKTTKLQQVLHDEHKGLVRKYGALKLFPEASTFEDRYFTAMNRFWRLMTASNRMICRRDFSFRQASKALDAISQD